MGKSLMRGLCKSKSCLVDGVDQSEQIKDVSGSMHSDKSIFILCA